MSNNQTNTNADNATPAKEIKRQVAFICTVDATDTQTGMDGLRAAIGEMMMNGACVMSAENHHGESFKFAVLFGTEKNNQMQYDTVGELLTDVAAQRDVAAGNLMTPEESEANDVKAKEAIEARKQGKGIIEQLLSATR